MQTPSVRFLEYGPERAASTTGCSLPIRRSVTSLFALAPKTHGRWELTFPPPRLRAYFPELSGIWIHRFAVVGKGFADLNLYEVAMRGCSFLGPRPRQRISVACRVDFTGWYRMIGVKGGGSHPDIGTEVFFRAHSTVPPWCGERGVCPIWEFVRP